MGTAAGEQKFNSLCILSLNIVNEKVTFLLFEYRLPSIWKDKSNNQDIDGNDWMIDS